MQVSEIKTSFEREKSDISDVTDPIFCEWVNFAVSYIFENVKGVDPGRFVKSQQYSFVVPPQQEDLPSDFSDIRQTNCGVYDYIARKRLVVTFDELGDENVTFSDSGGVSIYNESIKVQGGSSRGFTGDASATLNLSFSETLDLTDFEDGGAVSPNNDYISIWAYVGNTIPTSVTLEFSTNSDGSSVSVDQYSYSYSSLVAGWNNIKVLKSAFTSTGSPSWADLGYLRLSHAGGGSTTNIYWDKLNLVGNEINDYNDNKKKSNGTLGITGYLSSQLGFYFESDSITFTGSGLQDKEYILKYMPCPPEITDVDDYLTVDGTANSQTILEPRHKSYLVKALDVRYSTWDRDPSSESLADFRFVRELDFLLENYSRTPQVSVMKNPINYY